MRAGSLSRVPTDNIRIADASRHQSLSLQSCLAIKHDLLTRTGSFITVLAKTHQLLPSEQIRENWKLTFCFGNGRCSANKRHGGQRRRACRDTPKASARHCGCGRASKAARRPPRPSAWTPWLVTSFPPCLTCQNRVESVKALFLDQRTPQRSLGSTSDIHMKREPAQDQLNMGSVPQGEATWGIAHQRIHISMTDPSEDKWQHTINVFLTSEKGTTSDYERTPNALHRRNNSK